MTSKEEFYDRVPRIRDLMVSDDPARIVALEQERRRLADSRRLFSDDSGNPTLRRSFGIYMDHLGTRQRMKSFTSNDLRDHLRLIDAFIWNLHDPSLQKEGQALNTFSDNFIIGIIFDEDEPGGHGLNPALASIAFYQLVMATERIPIRGGIALGDLYMDERTVIGPALVEAVELEEELAVYPRIILSKDCIEVVHNDLGYYRSDFRELSPWNNDLLVDADDRIFINYLSCILGIDNEVAQLEALTEHSVAIRSELQKNYPEKIKTKWEWLADYHNYFCNCFFSNDSALIIVDELISKEQRHPRKFRPLVESTAR